MGDSNYLYGQPQIKGRQPNPKKAFLSIYWKCCHVYSRIYKNKSQTAYEGYCPRCRSFVSVPIGSEGTHQRTFIASK